MGFEVAGQMVRASLSPGHSHQETIQFQVSKVPRLRKPGAEWRVRVEKRP